MEHANEASARSSIGSSRSASLQARKRTRYTLVACDECKRRKIKCDGQNPCRRCVGHSTTCVYTLRCSNVTSRQDTEWMKLDEKISKLQEQISLLVSNSAAGIPVGQHEQNLLTNVSTSLSVEANNSPSVVRKANNSNAHARRRSRATRLPQYMGPTSSAFSFGIARSSLQGMGIQPGGDLVETAMSSYPASPLRSPEVAEEPYYARDPLLWIPKSEALRLVEIYEEESGTVYPFIDIKLVTNAASKLYDSASPAGFPSDLRHPGDENTLSGGILDILKLVIAIALVFEGHGPTTSSRTLLASVEAGFEARLCGPSVDVLEIQAWTLMSILQFHCDEEARAWRTIGVAARAAVELGLHRRDTYYSKFPDLYQRLWANKLFWCIYILDRRWSFGTGLPFALHDDDIDPELPEQKDTNFPLLKVMVSYGRIGSNVWKATSTLNSSASAETLAFLDFQVQQWQNSIPSSLRLRSQDENMLEGQNRTRNRLRILLYLCANQMRLLIFRRSLLSPKTITDDVAGAQHAVNIAKDTTRVLDRLNRASDIYSSQQTSFNYYLVSALAVMLLAVCHATARFSGSCREEFYMALELVRGFSAKSHVGRRLWRVVKHLKVIGPKLGLFPTRAQPQTGQNVARNAYVPHQVSLSERETLVPDPELNSDYSTNMAFERGLSPNHSFRFDGNQLTNELTNLYEAFEPSYVQLPAQSPDPQEIFNMYTYSTADDISRSLLDLF